MMGKHTLDTFASLVQEQKLKMKIIRLYMLYPFVVLFEGKDADRF